FYKSRGHIMSKVAVQGILVSVDEREKLVIYKVDDGTGIIACCCWRNTIKDSFTLGQSVTVQGKITEYRNQRQLTVNSISVEENLNAESLFWLDVVNLTRTFYSIPFVLPDDHLRAGQPSTTKRLLDIIQKLRCDGRLCFSFVDLCSMPEVQRIKETLLDSNENKNCLVFLYKDEADHQHSTRGNKEIREILSQLEKQGEIFYKHARKDQYEIMTHEQHLKPAILKALKDISKCE
ncbi:hypothetical protein QZH41_009162, partial [Actinostola sp. cb2023]